MLRDRIISTLKFFDLQDFPLTLLELHKFLLADAEKIASQLDENWEVGSAAVFEKEPQVDIALVQKMLDSEVGQSVETVKGFYCLKGRSSLIDQRLQNYLYGIKREKLIRKFARGLRHLPFVRGVALGGSQALGKQKPGSDMDLLIITDPRFMWLARTVVSVYFQVLGVRRYKNKTANRFCLNHYLAQPKAVKREKNLYKAMEYLRLRPLVYGQVIAEFQAHNLDWLQLFFPQAYPARQLVEPQSKLQKVWEKIFLNKFGEKLESWLKFWETRRIRQDKFTFITEDELSFHPESRHMQLLQSFFALSKR
jgi:predicted nucleotidyltransferase